MDMSTGTLTSETFLKAIELTAVHAQVHDEAYEATSQYVPWPKAYGGDMVAQAAAAMMRSVDDDRSLHSMHSYFMRPVEIGATVRYEVEHLRDGRGYSTRSVRGYQNGKTVYAAMGSFQVPEDGTDYQPAGASRRRSRIAAQCRRGPRRGRGPRRRILVFEAKLRHASRSQPGISAGRRGSGAPPGHLGEGLRACPTSATSDANADLHRAALAYVCDYTILEPLLRVHGLHWSTPGLATASLDHSMWFHRDGRADDWVLYVQEAVSGQSNRGLAMGHFFDRHGRLLATVAQEGMIRAGS